MAEMEGRWRPNEGIGCRFYKKQGLVSLTLVGLENMPFLWMRRACRTERGHSFTLRSVFTFLDRDSGSSFELEALAIRSYLPSHSFL